jgi:hypothetical protein
VGNEANKGGAIIYIDHEKGRLDGDSVLVRNSASDGGALFVTRSKFASEIDSQILMV